jgi:glycosyltransferase involved in cell wall biosynthesis
LALSNPFFIRDNLCESVAIPSIIAFTKDWNDVPTCTTHILRTMGRTMPVLWINSIGLRRPQLGSGRDLRRVTDRLRRAWRGPEWKENRLAVLAPLVIPKARSPLAHCLNRQLLRWTARWSAADTEFWTFVPSAVDYVGCFRERKVIYYCVDDWSKFTNLDVAWIAQKETELLRRADLVFASSRFLEAKCRAVAGDRVHYMPHGVEHAKFAAALAPDLSIPPDLQQVRSHPSSLIPHPSPIIGFYGNINDWIDFPLIRRLAELRPAWSFVLIGPTYCDVREVTGLANVHLLGRREHDQLPAYCKGFDAALIPYRLDHPRMESVNPVKLRELLAAGVPVVAADLPEVRGISAFVRVARTAEEYLTGLECFLAGKPDRAAISAERRDDDWNARVAEIRRIVDAPK